VDFSLGLPLPWGWESFSRRDHLLANCLPRTGILAWYDHPISSGPMEGTNNKIKTMKRQAYGFRDMEFFKLRIMGFMRPSTL